MNLKKQLIFQKEIRRPEHEYMKNSPPPPPPINALVSPLFSRPYQERLQKIPH